MIGRPWLGRAPWEAVAAELRAHAAVGLGDLLTGDVARLATARALVASGVPATGLRADGPELRVEHAGRAALIAPVLPLTPPALERRRDHLVARPGDVDRLLVLIAPDHLRASLPRGRDTTAVLLPSPLLGLEVRLVDPLPATPRRRGFQTGAREEILSAVDAVLARSGGTTFTLAEITAEMARRGTGYAESTIRTMVTSHLCRNSPVHTSTPHDDLERVDRGRYRRTRHA
ncbi:hypothetical protein KCV87_09780 [Actinosynnema pretiosum subsp. pretiosum]|uniref:DUF7669 domain-containing protein n=2 Tax=Actinosynnema TaxID=40566 RepID=C6WFQ4_ACTMD|nr:hypothetical protein [Actinosynnema mirum]ACU35989.1 hypothetical protein Amir_2043 [Actinosynnema mirum DSM 43827]QUF06313.1 hypothetical protein KCV87_09780 [Actinosynnema pretiosum subsp. pretiosum]